MVLDNSFDINFVFYSQIKLTTEAASTRRLSLELQRLVYIRHPLILRTAALLSSPSFLSNTFFRLYQLQS